MRDDGIGCAERFYADRVVCGESRYRWGLMGSGTGEEGIDVDWTRKSSCGREKRCDEAIPTVQLDDDDEGVMRSSAWRVLFLQRDVPLLACQSRHQGRERVAR